MRLWEGLEVAIVLESICPGAQSVIKSSRETLTMKIIVILFSVVIAAAGLVFAAEEASTSAHKVMKPSNLRLSEPPPGLPAGGKMALLNGDPGQPGPFTVRLKAPAGYKIMPHTHPAAER